jgi:hypothetical protein
MAGPIDWPHIGGKQALAPLRFVNCRNADPGIFLDQFRIHAANVSDYDTHAISPSG